MDADAWESDPKVYRWIGDLAAHRPDYFFYTTGVHPKLFVVEVKGTSSSRAALVRQLARGVEQVGTIARVPGVEVRRVVVGTVVGRGLTGFAVEVPFLTDTDELAAKRQIARLRRKDMKPAPPGFDEADDSLMPLAEFEGDDFPVEFPREDVEEALLAGEDARLLTMAGLSVDLQHLKSRGPELSSLAADLPVREFQGAAYSGVTTSLQVDGGRTIDVFSGVLRDLVMLAAEGIGRTDPSPGDRRWGAGGVGPKSSVVTSLSGPDAEPSVLAQSWDGSAVEVRGALQ